MDRAQPRWLDDATTPRGRSSPTLKAAWAGRLSSLTRRPTQALAARPSETDPCSSSHSSSQSQQQQRSQLVIVAIIAAVAIGAIAIFAFLGRGPDSGALTGKTWQLTAITGQTPAFQGVFPPEEQALYTVEFATDGTLAAKADCNAVAGTYELSGDDGMTITLGASTLVACPDGSYGTIFAHELGNVTTWAIASAELTLTTADGGAGTFVEGSGTAVVPSPSVSPSDSASPPAPAASPTPAATASPTPEPTASPTPAATASPTPDGDRHGCTDR